MKRVLRAVSDTYITNKIIDNTFRATDANVGAAGTLDLFKLADESTFTSDGPFISGTTDPIELSRILIKFDLQPLTALTSSILDLNDSSFKCYIKLVDVLGGQTVPSNYTLILYPLSQSFDEGIGRDVYAFEDVAAANYLTASVSAGLSTWFASGASAAGYVGEQNVDYVTGSIALGNLFVTQTFTEGDEDLLMDITKIVSATLTTQLPNHGFRISFSGTQETDDRTRFVKRFATRHSTEPSLRPSIIASFDDSIQDNHQNFYFDVSGTLHLNNFRRGALSNIASGSSLTAITGSSSLLLTLQTGSAVSGTYYSKQVVASQLAVGQNNITGVYYASFAIPSTATGSIIRELAAAHSATFTEIWGSLDGTVGYYTGSLVVFDSDRSAFSNSPDNVNVTATNVKNSFKQSDKIRVRIFAQDQGFKLQAKKLPHVSKSLIFDNMHYRIVDVNTDTYVFDFDTSTNSTLLSTDSDGMYFDMYMSDLDVGRTYRIDILLDSRGSTKIYENVGATFRITP